MQESAGSVEAADSDAGVRRSNVHTCIFAHEIMFTSGKDSLGSEEK